MSMTREDAQETLVLLAAEFQIVRPIQLVWTERAKNGRANIVRRTLAIGPLSWRGAEACLLHEFAHFLCWQRGGRGHDKAFFQSLVDISRAWYGSHLLYPWSTEYRSLARMAGVKHWRAGRRRGK